MESLFPSQAVPSGSRGRVCGARCLLEISTCGREGKEAGVGAQLPGSAKAETTQWGALGKDFPWKDSCQTEMSGPLHSPTAQSRGEVHLRQRPDLRPDSS